MKRAIFVAAILSVASPAYAQVTLGTSTSATNPERSGDATTGLFSSTAGAVSISSGGTEIMRVNGTGVGIGTTNPVYPLEVQESSANTIVGVNRPDTAHEGNLVFLTNGTSEWNAGLRNTSTNDFHLYNFGTATDALTISKTTNYVGIGTSSPAGTLDVEGGTAAASTNGSPINLVAQNGGTGNENGGNIILLPGAAAGAGTPGTVGIGTASPATSLDVYTPGATTGIRSVATSALGTGSGGSFLAVASTMPTTAGQRVGGDFFGAYNGTTAYYTAGITGFSSEAWSSTNRGSYIQFETTATGNTSRTAKVTINPSGDVGIGTTSPQTLLTINANASGVPGVSGATNNAQIVGADSSNNGLEMDAFGYNSTIFFERYDGTFSSQSALLSGEAIGSLDGGGYNGSIVAPNTVGIIYVAGGNWSTSSEPTYITFGTTAVGSTTKTERMRIDTTGKVGIGTTTPAGTLDVEGGTAAASTNGSSINIVAQSAGTGNQNGGNIILTPGTATGTGTPGYVDIGTTSPIQSSQINLASAIGAVVGMQTANGGTVIQTQNTSGTASYAAMGFWTNGGSALTGSINVNSTSTSFNTTSDERIKTDFAPLPVTNGTGNIIDQLKPVTYHYLKAYDAKQSSGEGFVAQHLNSVIPSAVTPGDMTYDAYKPAEPRFELWQVDLSKIVPHIVADLQNEHNVIRDLQKDNSLLKSQLEADERAIAMIKTKIGLVETPN